MYKKTVVRFGCYCIQFMGWILVSIAYESSEGSNEPVRKHRLVSLHCSHPQIRDVDKDSLSLSLSLSVIV